MDLVQRVRRFVALANGDVDGPDPDRDAELLDLLHPDYVCFENGRETLRGPGDVLERLHVMRLASTGFREEIVEIVREGDVVVSRWKMSGLPSSAGSIDGITWIRFREGRLASVHQWWEDETMQALVASVRSPD